VCLCVPSHSANVHDHTTIGQWSWLFTACRVKKHFSHPLQIVPDLLSFWVHMRIIVLLSASPGGEARLPMPKGMAYKEWLFGVHMRSVSVLVLMGKVAFVPGVWSIIPCLFLHARNIF
jgi:hypothetical protein